MSSVGKENNDAILFFAANDAILNVQVELPMYSLAIQSAGAGSGFTTAKSIRKCVSHNASMM